MKSKLFRDGIPSDRFSKDLKAICQLSITPAQLQALSKRASEWTLAGTGDAEARALESLRKVWPLDVQSLETVINVASFFLRRMEVDDTTEDILSDIEELALIEPQEVPSIRGFIDILLGEVRSRFAIERKVAATEQAAVRNIRGITHVVDLRAVVMNRAESGEDLTTYKPRIHSCVPVVIFRLRLSDDELCLFQVNRHSLELLKKDLFAAEKELHAAISFVNADKVSMSDRRSDGYFLNGKE